jgi:purine-nucleoside phosphorylase
MNRTAWEPALARLRTAWPEARPTSALILGSGWGEAIRSFQRIDEMAYTEIPGLGAAGVAGHAGRLALARAGGEEVLIFQGRRHFYEGVGWEPVALPVFLCKSLGVSRILLTNAAGGIRPDLLAGDLMILEDHIQLMGASPLVGPHDAFWGPRFPDQTRVYDPALKDLLEQAGRDAGVAMKRGVYLAVSGPSYETPAEIRAFSRLGADAVGMSTAPEATLAHAAGLRVCAISCITNLAAGISPVPLTHEEVTAATAAVMPKMQKLLAALWDQGFGKEGARPS